LDEAVMERAGHGPAATKVLMSEEAEDLPLQKCVQVSDSKIIIVVVRNNCHI
jgi:hypothetical protein